MFSKRSKFSYGQETECAACLDALFAKAVCSAAEKEEDKQLLLQIASILTKPIELRCCVLIGDYSRRTGRGNVQNEKSQ
jgi:hypothetical protein